MILNREVKRNINRLRKKIPRKIQLVFFLFLFFSLFVLINESSITNSQTGLFIKNIVAQISQGVSSTFTTQQNFKDSFVIVDSFGRAKVMSPKGRNPIKTVAELNGRIYGIELENKGGFNNAIPLDRGAVRDVDKVMKENNIKLSYILGLTVEPNVSGAIAFIEESVDLGMIPIIRLCFDGGCGFNLSSSADQIIDFYREVASELEGTDYEFIAVLGPNEPGTGNEATGFGVPPVDAGGYNLLIRRANEAAEALQEYRFENGGPMYLAPAIFNVTNTQNDDVAAYLFGQFGNSIDPSLFDYLLGNTYNLANGDGDLFYNEAIGNRDQSMRSYAETNDLPVIFTEIGFFTGDYLRLKATYKRMCEDSTVDGLMFFRPLPKNIIPGDESVPRQDPPITASQMKEIIESCSDTPNRPAGRKRWLNANFDSCVPSNSRVAGDSIGNYSIPESICSINQDKDKKRIINFGDSLAEESSSSFGGVNVDKFAFPGASTRWFNGERLDITNQFDNVIVKQNAFAARIIIGTNDIGSSSGNTCTGISDLNESFNNIQSIVNRFRNNGIIPIIVTIPARDNPCQSRMNELNSKIKSFFGSVIPLIPADTFYTSSDLRDDRHLKDYTLLNNTSKKLLNDLALKCGVSGIKFDDIVSPTPSEQGRLISPSTRYSNFDGSYALGDHVLNSCGSEFESKDNSILTDRKKGPQFLLNCSGSSCNISWSGYEMIEAPIKSLASTNPSNSANRKTFSPISSYIGTFALGKGNNTDKDLFDPLNQFAHGLESSSGEFYPMPWLGSLVNNVNELLKLNDQFIKFLNSPFSPNSFSSMNKAVSETERELDFSPKLSQKIINQSSPGIYGIKDGGGAINIPDERAICIVKRDGGDLRNFSDANCMDNRDFSTVKSLREYDFTLTSQNWKSVELPNCKAQNMKLLNSSDEYIPGPEVKVTEGSESFSASEVCWRFGNRDTDQSTKDLWSFKYDRVSLRDKPNYNFSRNSTVPTCTVQKDATVPMNYNCSTALALINSGRASRINASEINNVCRSVSVPSSVQVQEYCSSIINQRANSGENQLVNCDMKDGKCNFPQDTKNTCFNYLFNPDHETYVKNNAFPSFKEYSIPQLNDTIYNYYTLLNNSLALKNLKFVFGDENLGWALKVHSILRDQNKSRNDKYISPNVFNEPYLYIGESQNEQCTNDTSKFFQNDAPKARGRSDIVSYQYFPWAGTLDVMQEILMVYANNATLPDVRLARDQNGELKLKDGKTFLETAKLQNEKLAPAANLAISRPFLTCDERIACAEEKDADSVTWCPIEDKEIRAKIIDDFSYPCIDLRLDSGATKNSYKDALGEYLCEKGYAVDGVCSNIQLKCDIPPKNIPIVKSGDYENVFCPIKTSHTCFQGPFGGYSHCRTDDFGGVDGLPLDLFSNITESVDDRDVFIYSPEEGIVFSVRPNTFGTEIKIKGKRTGIDYVIQHLDQNTVPQVGTEVKAGDLIGEYEKKVYSYSNWHIHVLAFLDGKAIDPYLLFGEILGCNAVRPTQGLGYRQKATPGMCQFGKTINNDLAGISNTLNDNSCPERLSTQGGIVADNEMIVKLFEVYKKSASIEKPVPEEAKPAIRAVKCSYSKCDLPPKNGIPYPPCPDIDYQICDNPQLMNNLFANSSINNIADCDQKIATIGSAIPKTLISFLGNNFTVNSKIVDVLKKVEEDIKSKAISFSGSSYVFPSGVFNFTSGGAFNPRRIRGTESSESCLISNHSWGTALDLSVSTNPYTNFCSTKFDMPPEVVQSFEKYGFRWGGRYPGKVDYMHFEYCVGSDFIPKKDDNNYLCENPSKVEDVDEGGDITRERILNLCSPKISSWVDVTVDQVYQVYNKFLKYEKDPINAPNRTQRILQILETAKKQDINPAFLFAIWLTEGGYLGDGVAGGSSRNPYGFDFGCGLRPACEIASRDGVKPDQLTLDQGFVDSLNCAAKTGTKCKLACEYNGVTKMSKFKTEIGGITQEPGIGGFLECYGPIADNNKFFALNFLKVYDAFYPPESNHPARRINDQKCNLYL